MNYGPVRLSVNNSYSEGLLNCIRDTITHMQQKPHKITQLWLWLSSQYYSYPGNHLKQCNLKLLTGSLVKWGRSEQSFFWNSDLPIKSTWLLLVFFGDFCVIVWTEVGSFPVASLSSLLLYHSPPFPWYCISPAFLQQIISKWLIAWSCFGECILKPWFNY